MIDIKFFLVEEFPFLRVSLQRMFTEDETADSTNGYMYVYGVFLRFLCGNSALN